MSRSTYNPLYTDAYIAQLEEALNAYDGALLAVAVTAPADTYASKLYTKLRDEYRAPRSSAIANSLLRARAGHGDTDAKGDQDGEDR